MTPTELLEQKKNNAYLVLKALFSSVNGDTTKSRRLNELPEQNEVFGAAFVEAYNYLFNEKLIRIQGVPQYTACITQEAIQWLADYDTIQKKEENIQLKQPITNNIYNSTVNNHPKPFTKNTITTIQGDNNKVNLPKSSLFSKISSFLKGLIISGVSLFIISFS